jgi:hypothetical protein
MWLDPELDVVSASAGIARVQPGQRLVGCYIEHLYPDAVPIHTENGTVDICEDDIIQGSIGDCWLLSALATIAYKQPQMIKNAILWSSPYYKASLVQIGSFRTFVDHTVPVIASGNAVMDIVAPRLSTQKEFWPILIEKAFIKMFHQMQMPMNVQKRMQRGLPVFGAHYSDIHGGLPRWVFEAFLDTPLQIIQTSKNVTSWEKVFEEKDGFTCLACACTSTEYTDSVQDDGFVFGHAYSVLYAEDGKIRVRNPWSTYENTKYDDGLDDGEFWVDEEMFRQRFPLVCVVKVKNRIPIKV